MAEGLIIIQIMFITLGMFFLGLLYNHFFGINREEMEKYQEKAKKIQERMRNAQLIGDPQLMQQIQRESMEITKDVMKKQFVPLCVRCFIFLGIFAILGAIYAPYSSGLLLFPIPLFGSGWAAIYLLFSLGFSLIYFILKKVYQKATGKETKKPGLTGDMMNMLSPSQNSTSEIIDYSEATLNERETEKNTKSSEKKGESWKDKLDT